ncbi:MAG: HisA/HisF-related TIM barrel protein, partial [Planctomycetes bacterium]|nr:HisA/HisF-related TIM barrel protein [Planctomycetota bacterium]
MIVPSIDLMGGKAVQLRQGRERVLTSDRDPVELAAEFNRYGEVAVIDLDAALGRGDNLELVRRICRVADVRAGGGIRDGKRGDELLRAGARRLIVGTAAAPDFLRQFPADRVMVAIDHRRGEVVDEGWTRSTGESWEDRAKRLAPFCFGFLCTFVEVEGGLGGLDLEAVREVQEKAGRPVTVAGGVAGTEDALAAARLGVDVQVGMALYTGRLDLAECVAGLVDFGKSPLVPTVVRDEAGQVLMVAFSSPDSLRRALREGKGIYFSRSRNEIWEKGLTSGHVQALVSCRLDCDRDALLFTVRQTGPACHTGSYSCFGDREFGLPELFETLRQRKRDLPEGSYSAKLFRDREKLKRKIMEEAFETATAKDRRNAVWEIA